MTANDLTTGCTFTVRVPETFVRAQQLLGNDRWKAEYTFAVERVELPASEWGPGRTMLAVYSVDNGRRVYLGELDARTGEVRLTKKSAFPATATRVLVCRRTLARVAAGQEAAIKAAGWELVA